MKSRTDSGDEVRVATPRTEVLAEPTLALEPVPRDSDIPLLEYLTLTGGPVRNNRKRLPGCRSSIPHGSPVDRRKKLKAPSTLAR